MADSNAPPTAEDSDSSEFRTARLLPLSFCFWGVLHALAVVLIFPFESRSALGDARPVLTILLCLGLVGSLWSFRRILRTPGGGLTAFGALRLVLVAVVGTLALYVTFSEFDEITASVALGLGLGAAGLASGLRTSGAYSLSVLRVLDVLVFNLCLALVLFEAALHIASLNMNSVLFHREDMSVAERVSKTRLQPGRLRFSFPANGMGYYDEEFSAAAPGERTVLSIADSFSVTPVPHHFHFTTVAERHLERVRILNMGMSAIGPQEYLHLLLEEGLPLQPDAVVVNLFIGNDLGGGFRNHDRAVSLLSRFLKRENLLLWTFSRRLSLLLKEGRNFREPDGSAVGNASEIVLSSRDDLLARYPWLEDPSQEEGILPADKYLRVEMGMAQANSGLTRKRVRESLHPLQKMREALGNRPFGVVLIPAAYQVEEELWQRLTSRSNSELDRDRPQELVKLWLGVREIPYLDLLDEFRASPPLADGQRHLYHRDDTHLNRRGNELAGLALARFTARLFEAPES